MFNLKRFSLRLQGVTSPPFLRLNAVFLHKEANFVVLVLACPPGSSPSGQNRTAIERSRTNEQAHDSRRTTPAACIIAALHIVHFLHHRGKSRPALFWPPTNIVQTAPPFEGGGAVITICCRLATAKTLGRARSAVALVRRGLICMPPPRYPCRREQRRLIVARSHPRKDLYPHRVKG